MYNSELKFRLATAEDLVDIVKMLADDPLGSTRENFSINISDNYLKAFENILKDSNQELTIIEMNGKKVGTYQLTFIQYLTHGGGLRAQIEAVRINSNYRRQGIGAKMFEYIIERARKKGCIMLQLTSDKKRPEAIKFYETVGLVATHEGMKLKL
jgi:GNAT superfamily N-acetyltransferase